MSDEIDTRDQVLNDATRWMAEIQFVSGEQFLNSVVLNIYRVSRSIRHVEIINDSNQEKMLIFLKLTKWGMWFKQESIAQTVLAIMGQVLTSYEFRVIYDQKQFDKSLELAKKVSLNKSP